MKTEERRKGIIALLALEKKAISGSDLAVKFGVSRQIIVNDVSHLKECGYEIISTHHGYFFQSSPQKQRVFKVKHTTEETQDELSTIIGLGGTVENVFVWHKVYGKIEANLNIFSLLGIERFIEGVRSGKSTELMNITGGYHYHTVRADTEDILDLIEAELNTKGYIVPEKN